MSKHARSRAGRHARVLRQDALTVASANPAVAAEVDAQWAAIQATGADGPTVGDQLAAMDELCADVLREHGYDIG